MLQNKRLFGGERCLHSPSEVSWRSAAPNTVQSSCILEAGIVVDVPTALVIGALRKESLKDSKF